MHNIIAAIPTSSIPIYGICSIELFKEAAMQIVEEMTNRRTCPFKMMESIELISLFIFY
jgi:hypothetical protein